MKKITTDTNTPDIYRISSTGNDYVVHCGLTRIDIDTLIRQSAELTQRWLDNKGNRDAQDLIDEQSRTVDRAARLILQTAVRGGLAEPYTAWCDRRDAEARRAA